MTVDTFNSVAIKDLRKSFLSIASDIADGNRANQYVFLRIVPAFCFRTMRGMRYFARIMQGVVQK